MHGHSARGLFAVVVILAGIAPAPAAASVLCKNSRGNLLVRDACRSRETALSPAAIDQLGIRGPAGPAGPPGPSGGGLHVVDAVGSEVGVVTSISSYYGQYARVARRMTLPDGSTPEFAVFSVTPTGLRTSDYACGSYYGTYYRNADCTGPRYQSCEYGSCSSATPALLFVGLTPGTDGVACYARGGSEFERGDFYRQFQESGSSAVLVAQTCANEGGTIIGPIAPCDGASPYFCGQCCAVQHGAGVALVHTVDLTQVGTPPFRLAR